MADEEIHIEGHESLIKTPTQLAVTIALAFIVPVALIVLITQYVTGGMRNDPNSPTMSEDAIAKRIKPVGEIALGDTAAVAAAAVPAATPAAPAAPAKAASGQEVFDKSCNVCHGAGIAGAPKAGDKGAWSARLAQGKDTLYEHAIKGIRTMPAKGGNAALSDAEVKAAVDHMVGLVK